MRMERNCRSSSSFLDAFALVLFDASWIVWHVHLFHCVLSTSTLLLYCALAQGSFLLLVCSIFLILLPSLLDICGCALLALSTCLLFLLPLFLLEIDIYFCFVPRARCIVKLRLVSSRTVSGQFDLRPALRDNCVRFDFCA